MPLDNFQKMKKQKEEISFYEWMREELPVQYDERVKILNEAGLLQILGSGEMGIVGIDGKEYPLTTFEELKVEIEKNRDVYERKVKQGFVELEIVPFALPLDALGKRMIANHQKGSFFIESDNSESLEPLALALKEPVSLGNGLSKDADLDGTLLYFPKQSELEGSRYDDEELEFDEFGGIDRSYGEKPSRHYDGISKQRHLDNCRKNSPLVGFNFYLREKYSLITKNPQSVYRNTERIEERETIEKGTNASDSFDILDSGAYEHESGQTLEDWVIQFIVHLEKTGEVIDFYRGLRQKGGINLLLGSLLDEKDWDYFVSAQWSDSKKQVFFSKTDAFSSSWDYITRPIVRIGKENDHSD